MKTNPQYYKLILVFIVLLFISFCSNFELHRGIVSGCSAAIMFAVVFMSLTWLRLQQGAKAAENIDYPAYGVTGPNKELLPSEDQRLAQSAQMYHFQHQKQQIIASEKNVRDPSSVSEIGSDEDNDEGDYTVYECPGLAPAGEIEVKNPLFIDDAIQGLTNLNSNQEDKH
ncbi:neural proliferation differentiation and control protein 1-like isoform X2 [Cotesia glomerata]|uniref:neural proliferation differentiation and control protein 1-like isoform X2 n=1 Tax=Cotesia glomerata TaxID=32391 RepID=UPI001D025464|nr:neural proliferation differentiation and control protein 1-like isoform X2 [Cotesia glomerata]